MASPSCASDGLRGDVRGFQLAPEGPWGTGRPVFFFLGLQRELEEEKNNSPPSIFWGAVPCWAFGGSDLQRVDALSVVFWIWGPHKRQLALKQICPFPPWSTGTQFWVKLMAPLVWV